MQDDSENFSPSGNAAGFNANIRRIKKPFLINKLNYINFQDRTIFVVFEHVKYPHTVTLQAKPLPCMGEELECIWPESEIESYRQLGSYKFKELQIPNGKDVLIVRPEDIFINGKIANFLLPETCHELKTREFKRYSCSHIKAQLIQNSIAFNGQLTDFNMSYFHIEVPEHSHQAFNWINRQSNLNLILTGEKGMIFSGECKICQVRNGSQNHKIFVIEPLKLRISRFATKDFRANRYQLVPSLYVIFFHPFTGKMRSLNILDISGSGFSVKEDWENGMLIPGMILPEIEIHLLSSFSINCKAQVIHRTHQGKDRSRYVKTGLAILDMDNEDHGKLLSLLHQAGNPNLYLNGKINEDDLWRFFFESGFIYPHKYKFIRDNKEDLKSVYDKIYNRAAKVAKNFIYRDKNEILGHLAMIRFYKKSWMIQHHAAQNRMSNIAGIEVLDQIGRFANESTNLISMNMDYVFCYFRPDNKFPNQVFGGASRHIKDPLKCSLDSFAYFHYVNQAEQHVSEMRAPWSLSETRPADLIELGFFYEHISGGLMVSALDLLPEAIDMGALKEEYAQFELKRERRLFSLKYENKLKALFVLNLADVGLNFSDLTNSIQAFIVEAEGVNAALLESAFSSLSGFYETKEIPVLFFPDTAAAEYNFNAEKTYQLWVLSTHHLDHYFSYMKRIFRKLNSIQATVEKETDK